ncbi:MAG: Flp1 family type IVb pilin [Lachnospiraceae bacterium]
MRQLFSSIPGQVLDFIVVLISLVALFKKDITSIVTDIMKKIKSNANSI